MKTSSQGRSVKGTALLSLSVIVFHELDAEKGTCVYENCPPSFPEFVASEHMEHRENLKEGPCD